MTSHSNTVTRFANLNSNLFWVNAVNRKPGKTQQIRPTIHRTIYKQNNSEKERKIFEVNTPSSSRSQIEQNLTKSNGTQSKPKMPLGGLVKILPRLLRFKENKRDQVITIENNTNAVISYEFSAAKYKEENGQIKTLFQSNQPCGKITAKNRERIIIQYMGAFSKKDTEKAEVLQVIIDDTPQQAITIDCEFESAKLDSELVEEARRKSDDDLGKIVNILNLNDEDPKQSKKGKMATLNEILKPLTPKFQGKKLKNLPLLTALIFLVSLLILTFSLYIAFLNGYSSTFKRMIDDYGLQRIVKLCMQQNIQDIKQMLYRFARSSPNSTVQLICPPADKDKL